MTQDDRPRDDTGPAADRLAREIRRLRGKAGLSQPQLATIIGYTPQYVSLAERPGKGLPSASLIRAIDTALTANCTLVALRDQAEAEQQAIRHGRELRPEAGGAGSQRRAITGLAVVTDFGREVTSQSQDRAALLAGDGVARHIVNMAADETSRFLAWAEEENVGDLTLERLHSQVRRISQSYLKVPTWPLFVRTRELRDQAFTLLAGRQRPSHARDLYAAAGWSLTMLAWMSVDLGRPDAAEDHARAAWLCAERAEHDGLRAWVRATQHTAARWQDDFAQAAEYAADGLRYATGSAALFLTSAYALDLARGGQDERAWDALRQAWTVAEISGTGDDELGGPFTCSQDRASGGFWSETQLALGAADAALDQADRALAAFEVTPREGRNSGSERMVRLKKVHAHLVLGQLDGAELALAPVLDTAPEHRVRPLLVRMNEVRAAATTSRYATEPIATRIRSDGLAFQQAATAEELGP